MEQRRRVLPPACDAVHLDEASDRPETQGGTGCARCHVQLLDLLEEAAGVWRVQQGICHNDGMAQLCLHWIYATSLPHERERCCLRPRSSAPFAQSCMQLLPHSPHRRRMRHKSRGKCEPRERRRCAEVPAVRNRHGRAFLILRTILAHDSSLRHGPSQNDRSTD